MDVLRIATRGSKLALWQAEHISSLLNSRYPKLTVELQIIKTKGDKILDVPLAKIGGKGLFVKEIEEALLDGSADIAVHSMKDVPAELPAGLKLGIIPKREVPTDCLLSVHYPDLAALPPGAKIGTSSLRRQTQLLHLRQDLTICTLRGNLDTRVGKLMNGDFDAIVVASAGMRRLGLSAPFMTELSPPDFYPAVAQGALGIEYSTTRTDLDEVLAFLDHEDSRLCVEAERAFLFTLDGGCQVPIAGFARKDGDTLSMTGVVGDLCGECMLRVERVGTCADPQKLGVAVAQEILDAGARDILNCIYRRTPEAEA